METKADKIASVAMGVIFLILGIWVLFDFPGDRDWYQTVLLEVVVFGCSLTCFTVAFFGIPGARK